MCKKAKKTIEIYRKYTSPSVLQSFRMLPRMSAGWMLGAPPSCQKMVNSFVKLAGLRLATIATIVTIVGYRIVVAVHPQFDEGVCKWAMLQKIVILMYLKCFYASISGIPYRLKYIQQGKNKMIPRVL